MKPDIKCRDDLMKLMIVFYDKLLSDKKISYLFTDIAKMDLKSHLPVIVDFWDMILFQNNGYQKNVMKIHMDLNEKSTFKKEHFDIWITNFNETVDEFFEGHIAVLAKQRAQSIATMMQIKMFKRSENNN